MNEQILNRLDALASKMGVAVGVLWSALVREGQIEGIEDFLLALLFGTTAYILAKNIVSGKWIPKDDDGFFLVAESMVAVVFGIVALIYAYTAPQEFFNPQYFALHKILEALSK